MKRRPDARYQQAGTQESAKVFIWLLCLVAGLRTFLFCAGFPFFNNADEQAHFDVVLKYSQGHLPAEWNAFSAESARYFVQYGSPEFFMSPEAFLNGHFPSPRGHPRQRELRPQFRLPNKRGAMRRIPSRGSRLCIMPSPVCG